MEEKFCVCMGCGYEWESKNPVTCPMCGSGDFHINEEGGENDE